MAKKPPLYPHVPKSRRKKGTNAWRCNQCGWTTWNVIYCPKCGSRDLEELTTEEVTSFYETGKPVIHQRTENEREEADIKLAVEKTQHERDTKEARELALQAADILKDAYHMSQMDSALWRLVDAAGLTARYADHSAVGQETNPTNRGYFVDQYPGLAQGGKSNA